MDEIADAPIVVTQPATETGVLLQLVVYSLRQQSNTFRGSCDTGCQIVDMVTQHNEEYNLPAVAGATAAWNSYEHHLTQIPIHRTSFLQLYALGTLVRAVPRVRCAQTSLRTVNGLNANNLLAYARAHAAALQAKWGLIQPWAAPGGGGRSGAADDADDFIAL